MLTRGSERVRGCPGSGHPLTARRFAATLLCLGGVVATTACGGTPSEAVTVERSGSSVSDAFVTVAALLRVPTGTYGPIGLRVSLRDAHGERVAETADELPYCPARTDCWWAASFPLDRFESPRAIRTADIQPAAAPPRYEGRARVLTFEVARLPDGRVRGRAPAEEGHAYVVGFLDGRPRGGISANVHPSTGRDVMLAPGELAHLGPGAELRGYFYAGRVPMGD
jgi:hypothetical protein